MDDYYSTTHANVHRGVYAMAEEATARYEGARASVARFIGAASDREVLFSKNVDRVAQPGGPVVGPGQPAPG